jgi:peptidoglycan/LPS O-acetylase OafA/YrhL
VTDALSSTRREQSASSFRLGKRPALDGFRGVAMLGVLSFHTLSFLVPGSNRERYIPGGFIGLNMFMVLSGLLITSLLLDERSKTGGISLRGFYSRRARRIFPPLIPVLIAFVAWSAAYGDPLRPLLPDVGFVSLFSANLAPAFGTHIPWALSQTWSLGIEEQFYLLWPISLLLVLRRCRPRTILIILTVVTAAMAITGSVAYGLHHSPIGFFERLAEGNGLVIGCGLALALHWGWKPPNWLRLATLPALALLVVTALTTFIYNPWLPYGGNTLIDLAGAIILLAILDQTSRLAWAFSWSPLCYCGKISYAFYLWHMLLYLAVVEAWPEMNTVLRVAVCVSGAIGVAIASRYLVELPAMRRGSARVAVMGAVASAPAFAGAAPAASAPAPASASAPTTQ